MRSPHPWRSSPYASVLGHPIMRRVLPGYTVSSLGDGMSVVAVSWLAIELAPPADRGLWVAAATAAYTLSGAVGAILLGRFLSHRNPAHLAAADAGLRAAALGAIGVGHAVDALNLQLYVVLLAVSSILDAWGSAGTYTLLARVLPERDHLAGNAVLSSVGSLATVLGPPLAGLIILGGGAALVLTLDAVTYLLLALTLLAVARSIGGPDAEPPDDISRVAGWTTIRQIPALFGLLTLSFGFFFLFGPVYVALPLHVSDDLGASAGQLAAFYSAFGIGAVLGSVLAGFLRRWPLWPTLIGLVVGSGISLLPIGLGAPTGVAVGCLALTGLLWPPYATLSTTLFQRATPRARLPQALAVKGAVAVLSVPLGTALGGPLVTAFGASTTLLLSALGITTVGLLGALAGLRAWECGRPHRSFPGVRRHSPREPAPPAPDQPR